MIVDLLGYKALLWDASDNMKTDGLTDLYERYVLLLHALRSATTIEHFEFRDEAVHWIKGSVSNVIASDTIMLWSDLVHAPYLLAAASFLVVRALGWGCPLRGAMAYGECIFDIEKRILIGYPIVEAVQAEGRQDWIGIGVLPAAAAALQPYPQVVRYDVPIHPPRNGSAGPPLTHALAWHWAEQTPNAAEIYAKRLLDNATPSNKRKYEQTLAFISRVRPPE